MLLIPVLVITALAIIISAFGWAWANGSLVETSQERVDYEFELMVRKLAE